MAAEQITIELVAPNRVTGAATFSVDADTWSGLLTPWTDQANALAIGVNADAVSAAASAESAALFTDYRGDWAAVVGALPIGASVSHNSSFWVATVAIANAALSEPSGGNTDWAVIGLSTTDPLPAYSESDSTGLVASGGTLLINLSLANEFIITMTAATQINFTGKLDNGADGFTIRFIDGDSFQPTLDANVTRWKDGVVGVPTAPIYEMGFKSYSGETVYTGYVIGAVAAP